MSVTTYKISKSIAAKKLEIEVGDQMTLTEAQRFVKEFSMNVESITPSQFDLHINCKNMKVLTQDLAQQLEQAIEMYKQAGFKQVTFLMPSEVFLKMQISRLCRKVGLTNVEIRE